MGYGFIENIFCGKPINDVQLLTEQLATASTDSARAQSALIQVKSTMAVLQQQLTSCQTNTDATKKDLQAQITDLLSQKATLIASLAQAQVTITTISSVLDGKNNFSLLSAPTQAIALQYYNKYPEAFVTYGGRYWGTGRTRYDLDVKAFCLEGQNDQAVYAALNECRGKISQVLQDKPGLTFHEACDVAVMRIKQKTDSMSTYEFDSQSWGADEFWQFASETIAGGKGDCEDKAILFFVACRAAGIPRELLRIAAGMTFDNQGHCTDFYLASDLKFHHINSTTNYPETKDVKTLPLPGDSSESLNLQHIWFSATDDKTFNYFTTSAKQSMGDMKNDGFLKWLKFSAKKVSR